MTNRNLSNTKEAEITPTDVKKAFSEMPDLKHAIDDIDRYMDLILLNLQHNRVVTRLQLIKLTNSPDIIETLKDLHINELGRDKNAPLDPVAVASWGSVLLTYGVTSEVVEAIRKALHNLKEYKDKHQPDHE